MNNSLFESFLLFTINLNYYFHNIISFLYFTYRAIGDEADFVLWLQVALNKSFAQKEDYTVAGLLHGASLRYDEVRRGQLSTDMKLFMVLHREYDAGL